MNSPPRKRNAGVAAGEFVESAQQKSKYPTTRRVPVRTLTSARTHAFRESKPFAVVCGKSTGIWTCFSRYDSRAESEAVAHRLEELGCPSRVVAGYEPPQ